MTAHRSSDESSTDGLVIKVNAGGKYFHTVLSTLRRIDYVHGKWNFERTSRGEAEDEDVFVDCDPEVFCAVLELAGGKGPQFLQSLDGQLQARVRQQMREWHMDSLRGFSAFHFELIKTPHVMVFEARDTPGCKSCISRGHHTMGNTVLGSHAIPGIGVAYFEAEVLVLGKTNSEFGLGVAESNVPQEGCFLCGASNILAAGVSYSGRMYHRRRGHDTGGFSEEQFPVPVRGSRIGIFVDMDVGQLAFFLDGHFRAIHPNAQLCGKTLYPAFSVAGDTVLKVHTGIEPPCTEDAFILE